MTSSAPIRTRNPLSRAALTLVEAQLPSDPFLLVGFESFYREVMELKAQLGQHVSYGSASLHPQYARGKLLSLFAEQEEQVLRTCTSFGSEMYRQAKRVMACMADEIFSVVRWPSGSEWDSMEMELFEASEMTGLSPEGPCMKKLDLLLQQDDPAYRELAVVYFYALALNKKDDLARRRYLQPLAEMISGQEKQILATDRVFTQPYAHTLTENRVALLPAVNRWWLVLAGFLLLWLLSSWLLWEQVISPVDDVLHKIQQLLKL